MNVALPTPDPPARGGSDLDHLLATVHALGIRLRAVEGRLQVDAPKDAMTPELQAGLRSHRDELVARLSRLSLDEAGAGRELPALLVEPDARHEPFPLTDIQEAYWVGRRGGIELGAAIHVYLEIEDADLDLDRLGGAWNALVQRHEMLRAIVSESGQQQILAEVPRYEIEVDDLSTAPDDVVAARLTERRERMSCQRLPLDRWPLFELRAVRLPSGLTRLFFDIDCTLIDSWGVQILFREWVTLSRDPDAELRPLTLSFRDYVQSVARVRDTDAYAEAVAYWDARVPDLPPAPELPRRARSVTPDHPTFHRWEARLSAEQFAAFSSRAVSLGITPTSALIAAYAEVIGAWATSPRFTLNIPLFNRLPIHPDVDHTVGTFSSFTLLEVDQRAGATFAERARALHGRLLEDLQSSSAAGVRLLRDLNHQRGGIAAAAMPVVFTSFASGVSGMESFWIDDLSAALGEVVYSVTQTPQVWIDQQVLYQDGGVYLNWDAADELFPDGLIGAMFAAFTGLLERLATDEEAWTRADGADLPAPSRPAPTETREAVEAAETVESPDEPLVHQPFVRHATSDPGRPAIITPDAVVSYGELLDRARRLAAAFAALDAPPSAPVAMVLPTGVAHAAVALGALLSGRPYMPLDPDTPANRLARTLDAADAAIVISSADQVAELIGRHEPVQSEAISPDDAVAIIHTSGTTARPSGVVLSHRGLRNAIAATNDRFAVGPDDRSLAVTPVFHDMALYDLLGPLSSGGAVVMPDPDRRRDPSHWVTLLAEHRVTIWNSVPAMAGMLLDHVGAAPRLAGTALRLAFLGGDWIPLDTPPRLRRDLPDLEVVSVGGPTETTLWNIWFPIDEVDPDWASIPYGRPIPNADYRVMDDEGRERPVWAAGELCCTGVGVALGYIGDPERTARRVTVDPRTGERLYRTGDLGRRRPDGVIEILGRIDAQLSILGRRIEPAEIEATMASLAGVGAAIVVPTRTPTSTVLTAFYTSPLAAPPTPDELRAQLVAELPAYLIPQHLQLVDALPLSRTGKADRVALTARAEQLFGEQVLGELVAASADQVPAGGGVGPDGMVDVLADLLREVLGRTEPIDARRNFFDLGTTSVHLVQLHARVRDRLGIDLGITELFAHPNLTSLAAHLTRPSGPEPSPAEAETDTRPEVDADAAADGAIAIVSMSCRFPDADDVASFWQNLLDGRESVRCFTDDELLAAGVAPEVLARPELVKAATVLDGIDQFDAAAFGFSDREAELTDPQQRLFLECAWEALELAGYRSIDPDVRVGVFAGKSVSNYLFPILDLAEPVPYFQVLFGNDKDYIATQTSYKLGLTGPSVAMQTACSTSLVTLDAACAALRAGRCDVALSGGASIKIPMVSGYDGSPDAGMFSPDGHTRPFSADAAGTVPGSGVGVVLLKRLTRALADGDHIHAVIRGIGVTNDGAGKVGFTAPSVDGQRRAIEQAHREAGIDPRDVSYVEAHGTGTPLGDPIEVAALDQAFRRGSGDRSAPCLLGSVKANVGHLDSAAGVAGIIKTALALEHETVPATINVGAVSARIDFERTPFRVATDTVAWPRGDEPRRAGVSSFGVGGTNVHVVMEEAPAPEAATTDLPDGPVLVPVSARTTDALIAYAQRYRAHLDDAGPPADQVPADIAFTAQVGRVHFAERAVVVGRDRAELVERFAALAEGRGHKRLVVGTALDAPPKIAMLFTGHGAQHAGMGRDLYEHEPVFRAHLDRCDEILDARLGARLIDHLYAPAGTDGMNGMDDLRVAQTVLFAVETGLANLWRSWGIEPAALMGHSLGELVAAHVAGVLSLPDALALVHRRIDLMQSHGLPGRTIVAHCSAAVVQPLLDDLGGRAAIASFNGPENLVLSGHDDAITALQQALRAAGVASRDLAVSRAAHSPLMDPVAPLLEDEVRRLDLGPALIPIVSNLTGRPLAEGELDAPYLGAHMRRPVQLADGFAALRELGCDTFVEVGPQPTLVSLGQQCLGGPADRRPWPERPGAEGAKSGKVGDPALTWVHSLRRHRDDREEMLVNLGRLHVRGAEIHWDRLHPTRRRRVALPTYPFQRRRHWSTETIRDKERQRREGTAAVTSASLLGAPVHAPGLPPHERHFAITLDRHGPAWTREHGTAGVPFLPGAAFADLAAMAGAAIGLDRPSVTDLVIHRPCYLPVDDGRITLHTTVAHTDDPEPEITIFSAPVPAGDGAPTWTRHAEARLVAAEDAADRDALDLDALRDRASRSLTGDEVYASAAARGAQFGDRFRSLRQVWVDEDGGLGHIVADATLASEQAEQAEHVFPPALLDACLHTVIGCLSEHPADAVLLPASIDRFTVNASAWTESVPTELWARVRFHDEERADQVTASVSILDTAGHLVASVDRLRLVAVPATELREAAPGTFAGLFYQSAWRRHTAPDPGISTGREAVIVVAPGSPPAGLIDALRERYEDVTVLADLDAPEVLGSADVIHLAPLDPAADPGDDLVARTMTVARLVATLAATSAPGRPSPRLTIVSTAGHAVAATDRPNPAQAVYRSLARVAGLEHPELVVRTIDLDGSAVPGDLAVAARWIAGADAEPFVALREGELLVPRLGRSDIGSAQPDEGPEKGTVLDPDGVYVITGGLGRLGTATARLAVRCGARHLVLVSRSAADRPTDHPTDDPDVLAELRQAGAEVTVRSADVSDPAAVEQLITDVRSTGRPLRGVVHAAGIVDDALLATLTAGQVAAVGAAKARGTWNLHHATAKLGLDHFVLFSSSATVLAGAGQAGYAAANAYAAALVEQRRADGLAGLVVDWGAWHGTSTGGDDRLAEARAEMGMDGLSEDLGTRALDALMATDADRVMVAAIRWADVAGDLAVGSLADELRAATRSSATPGTPAVTANPADTAFVDALRSETAEVVADRLGELVRDQVVALSGITESELDVDAGFATLGIDSMGAVELRNQLQRRLATRLPATLAFNYPTVRSLAAHLTGIVVGPAAPGSSAAADETGGPTEGLSTEGLSVDELADRLEARLAGGGAAVGP